ncbi:MAG: hypothetical protein ABSD51_00435 [Candidatus Binatus sp.]|jgi:hypothetical protein
MDLFESPINRSAADPTVSFGKASATPLASKPTSIGASPAFYQTAVHLKNRIPFLICVPEFV